MKNKQIQINASSEWEKNEVGKIFDFLRSYAISRENLIDDTPNDKGIGNIHYGDIHAKFYSTEIDLRNISVPLVKDDGFNPNNEDFLIDGDLIMVDTSEDYEGVGVAVSVCGLGEKKVVGGLHTFVLRDNKKKTDQNFRQYIFCNSLIRNKLQKIANGVSVYGISKTNLSKIILNLPPLPEQKQISKVLETWDRGIEKLGRKIEIKKRVKKGLMRELLTGKTRLPGFDGKWKTINLGNVGQVVSGGTPDTDNKEYWDGDVLWITPTEITKLKGKYITATKRTITQSGLKNSSATLIPAYSLIICSRATVGDCAINTKEITTNQGFKNIIPDSINIEYLYYLITTKKSFLKRISSGSTFLEFSKKDLEKIKICIPLIREQTAIADILVASDKEIAGLERKLGIFKNQKKYLLNNLITGAIRTPNKL